MTENFQQGHRARLRNKILTGKADLLEDYEILELILMYAIPRKDVKPLAKNLIERFGSLGNVVSAPLSDLLEVSGVKESTAALLKSLQEVSLRLLKKETQKDTILDSWEKVENYCFALLARKEKEYVYLIALNSQNAIISIEQLQKGTVDKASLYEREVVEVLLKTGAVSFVLVHNHPSGSTRPSKEDIIRTQAIYNITKQMKISLFDHLIVSKKGCASLRAMGYL